MKFLVIDDDDDYRRLTVREIQHEFPDGEIAEISRKREFDDKIQQWDFDVVITDLENPELNGMEVCRRIRAINSYLPVIMLTASGSEDAAVEGMKMGLSDYVTKNHLQRLPVSIRECLEKSRVSKEYDLLRMRQSAQFYLTEIFSESASLDEAGSKLLQAICRGFGWEIGELWRVSSECNILFLETLWSEPNISITEFEEISRIMTFSPGEGIPGRVWSSGEPAIWVTDVLKDNHFQRSAIAARLGLHGTTAFPITKSGEVTGVMVFFSKKVMPLDNDLCNVMADIGKRIGVFINQKVAEKEKEKLREQLYHVQKIDSLGTLAGGIAHDFNNILTAIIGYGELLKMKLKGDYITLDYVNKILESAERASVLTGGLLDFSRKRPGNPVPVDMNEVINGIKEMLERIISENINFSTIFTSEKCIVLADLNQMEQVLVNLAANARDAMPDGGNLTIKTDVIEIDQFFINAHGYGNPGRYCLISVSDTGSGMDEETRKRIFEPFFTTKEVGKGTGLGLSIVYGIIKQHNGYINVYSEQGRGTSFNVYLPLIQSEVEKKEKAEQACPSCGTETILLAEDDVEIRELAKMVLNENGYKVIDAVNGEDAIEKFKVNKDSIDLLVLDIIMPEMNGKEVYDVVKETNPGIKALFMSGYSRDIIQDKDESEWGGNFILKPFSPLDLLKKIRQVLDNK